MRSPCRCELSTSLLFAPPRGLSSLLMLYHALKAHRDSATTQCFYLGFVFNILTLLTEQYERLDAVGGHDLLLADVVNSENPDLWR